MTVTTTGNVPLVDLRAQHDEVAAEVEEGFARVLGATAFIGGPDVAAFEDEFARYCSAAHCVGLANGTDAIELSLRARGIGVGDEVIVPANTFIATAEAVARAGARPVLVDADPEFHLIDPDLVEARLTPRTRAVIGVHLFGQHAPMERLAELIDDRPIDLIEDAAQAQGATRLGRSIGGWSVAAATSFYPGKNLGAYGDAGAVVTHREEVALAVRKIANHGGIVRYEHELVGCNARLDTLQAVVLRAKLKRLEGWNDARRSAAERYEHLLQDVPDVVRPRTMPGNIHVWHLYVVKVPRRDEVIAELNAAGIGAGIHYPAPVHLTAAFSELGDGPGSFPVAEGLARSMISLPLFPHITEAQQDRVVGVLAKALR